MSQHVSACNKKIKASFDCRQRCGAPRVVPRCCADGHVAAPWQKLAGQWEQILAEPKSRMRNVHALFLTTPVPVVAASEGRGTSFLYLVPVLRMRWWRLLSSSICWSERNCKIRPDIEISLARCCFCLRCRIVKANTYLLKVCVATWNCVVEENERNSLLNFGYVPNDALDSRCYTFRHR